MTVEQLVLSCRNDLRQIWVFDQDGTVLAYNDPYSYEVKEYYNYEVAYFDLDKVDELYDVSIYDLNITVEV